MGIVSLYRSGRIQVWPDVLKPQMDDRAAPDLGPVVKGEAEPVYVDPKEFFARTHLTRAMEELIEDVADTLAGKGGHSIFLLMSFFGGGKTHTLVALYHAFRDPSQLPEKLAAKVAEAGKPLIVVLDGNRREFMPTPSQPHVEGGFTIKTVWGMLAYRLGAYALVRDLDNENGECPDVTRLEDVLRQAKAPVLILMDEAVIHLHNLMHTPGLRGYAERFKVFLDRLARAVSNCKRVVIVASVQAELRPREGEYELLTEEAYRDSAREVYRTLARLASRLITPVPPGDVVKVLQKQIFKAIPAEEASKARDRLLRVYREHRELFGAESDWELKLAAESATPKDTYPYHPKYIEVLYEFVTRNRSLQKTRDAVKITRKVVRRLLQRGDEDPDFIMPWHIRLDSPELLNLIMSGELSHFRSVVQRDIVSEDGRPGLVSSCSKPELALMLSTAILLKTYTYETHKIPLKTFPDAKEAALMVYEPSVFSAKGWQPSDIETALDEMSGRLRHFNSVDGRYWFDPYKSILEYVEGRADELFHGPRQQLYMEIAEHAKAILAKKEKGVAGEEPVFDESRVVIHYFSGPPLAIQDSRSLRLVVMLRPDVEDSDLEDAIFRLPGGAKRVFRNTVAVLVPREDRFASMLRLAAKLKATEEAAGEIKSLYPDEEVRKIQQDRLKKYEQSVENELQELILATLRVVAYPASEGGKDIVKRVETAEANSLIAQAEAGLSDTRTGPKLRRSFSFVEMHELLERVLGWNLIRGQSPVELREIIEFFYSNPAAPFTTISAIEAAVREGVGTLDIAVKVHGSLYWKAVGSRGCRPLPPKIGENAEILPYKVAAREFRDALLRDSGVKQLPDKLVVRYYEVEFQDKTIRLEDLEHYPGWEDILKDGVVHLREKVVPRGILLRVSPSSMTVEQGEQAVATVEVQPAGGYDLEVKLEVDTGSIEPVSSKPPFSAEWQLPALNSPGTYRFRVKGLGADGVREEETLTVEVKSLEEPVTVSSLDINHVGAKLTEIEVTDLTPLLVALGKVSSLGLKGFLDLQCTVGDSMTFTCARADIEIAKVVVTGFANVVRMLQNVKAATAGSIKLAQPEVLDDRKITALNTLAGQVRFRLLVRRR